MCAVDCGQIKEVLGTFVLPDLAHSVDYFGSLSMSIEIVFNKDIPGTLGKLQMVS